MYAMKLEKEGKEEEQLSVMLLLVEEGGVDMYPSQAARLPLPP